MKLFDTFRHAINIIRVSFSVVTSSFPYWHSFLWDFVHLPWKICLFSNFCIVVLKQKLHSMFSNFIFVLSLKKTKSKIQCIKLYYDYKLFTFIKKGHTKVEIKLYSGKFSLNVYFTCRGGCLAGGGWVSNRWKSIREKINVTKPLIENKD